MNVLLINPSDTAVYGEMKSPEHPHMGLAYIAAVIERAGHEVSIFDMHAENFSHIDLNEMFKEKESDLAGITETTPIIHIALKMAELIKSLFPSLPSVKILGIACFYLKKS